MLENDPVNQAIIAENQTAEITTMSVRGKQL